MINSYSYIKQDKNNKLEKIIRENNYWNVCTKSWLFSCNWENEPFRWTFLHIFSNKMPIVGYPVEYIWRKFIKSQEMPV